MAEISPVWSVWQVADEALMLAGLSERVLYFQYQAWLGKCIALVVLVSALALGLGA